MSLFQKKFSEVRPDENFISVEDMDRRNAVVYRKQSMEHGSCWEVLICGDRIRLQPGKHFNPDDEVVGFCYLALL